MHTYIVGILIPDFVGDINIRQCLSKQELLAGRIHLTLVLLIECKHGKYMLLLKHCILHIFIILMEVSESADLTTKLH